MDGKPGKNPYKITWVPEILVVKSTSPGFRVIQPVLRLGNRLWGLKLAGLVWINADWCRIGTVRYRFDVELVQICAN